jgi:hypothetical protein
MAAAAALRGGISRGVAFVVFDLLRDAPPRT